MQVFYYFHIEVSSFSEISIRVKKFWEILDYLCFLGSRSAYFHYFKRSVNSNLWIFRDAHSSKILCASFYIEAFAKRFQHREARLWALERGVWSLSPLE